MNDFRSKFNNKPLNTYDFESRLLSKKIKKIIKIKILKNFLKKYFH
jgi:hypothetical protein